MAAVGLRAKWIMGLLIILIRVQAFHIECANQAIFEGKKIISSLLRMLESENNETPLKQHKQ